jgi:hypothetical protein
MGFGTGCVSIGAPPGSKIGVDRVIEYIEPAEGSCIIWVDIFLHNASPEKKPITVLHRGSLSACDVTRQSWPCAEPDDASFEASLTRRLMGLHRDFDPIARTSNSGITLAGLEYIPANDVLVRTVAGAEKGRDVPFSMWEIDSPAGVRRHLVRLRLEMTAETFQVQIGAPHEFYAYGEEILFQKVEYEDLPFYEGDDAAIYRQTFAAFKKLQRIVPDMFEYLIVCEEGQRLAWQATPIADISAPLIADESVAMNTAWFVADILHSADWKLLGRPKYNGFVLRITNAPAEASSLPGAAASTSITGNPF